MNGPFERFPYTNFHDLNMDWIIKIAKDFLDQYTNIQETIENGLEALDTKATELENLLQDWYDTHSADIANQLAEALNDLNEWYTTHENYLDQTLADNIALFNQRAETKGQEVIESIPDDYTALSNEVDSLSNMENAIISSLKTEESLFNYGYRYSVNNPVMWETGLINPQGADVDNADCERTADFLPKQIERVHLQSSSGLQIRIVEYNDDGTFHSNYDWTPLGIALNSAYKYRVCIRRVSGGSSVSAEDTQKVLLLIGQIFNNSTRDIIATMSNKQTDITKNIELLQWQNAYIDTNQGTLVSSQLAIAEEVYFSAEIVTLNNPAYQYCLGEYDSSNVFIRRINWRTGSILLQGNKKYRISIRRADGAEIAVNEFADLHIMTHAGISFGKYYNKKLSILGDSISTYQGYIPTEHYYYPTQSAPDVTRVEDTWWYKLMTSFNMQLCINNSYSGSCISGAGTSGAPSGYERSNNLHNGTVYPDVIIIAMGVNDFLQEVPLGTYNGTQTFPSTDNTFRNAYAMTLNRVLTKYPKAEVYCATIINCERYDTSGFPERRQDVLLNDFNNAIRELANLFGCKVLDHDKCGITYQNLNIYMGDWANYTGQGLHPNEAGHSLIANNDIRQLDNSIRIEY